MPRRLSIPSMRSALFWTDTAPGRTPSATTELNSRTLDAEDVRQWSRYFDWVLVLAPEDEAEVVAQLQKEKPVAYVTSWEKKGFTDGEKSGYDRGAQEATTRGCQNTIEAVLEVRFGPDAHAIHEELEKRTDSAELQKLIDASKTVASLDAFRALLG